MAWSRSSERPFDASVRPTRTRSLVDLWSVRVQLNRPEADQNPNLFTRWTLRTLVADPATRGKTVPLHRVAADMRAGGRHRPRHAARL
jgi:hypothetical protein